MDKHEEFMRIALELAERGRGMVEPNPLVGAVIVNDNKIVGRGYHKAFGGPHAEVNAINDAGDNSKGATLYVTLEPCTHQGKTPPCVKAIKQAGIKNVVFAVHDPNPAVEENRANELSEAGIGVISGILKEKATEINAPFFKLIKEKMPYVIAKWAMSLDGKIATSTGNSRWISSEESRLRVHKIRGEVDAVMVGIGTIMADDPLLTCRSGNAKRIPKRIIIDNRASLPLDSQLIKTINDAEVFVAITNLAAEDRIKMLENAGCKIIKVETAEGLVDLNQVFENLGRMQLTNVLVEGGGKIFGSLFDNCLVDKVMIFIAPKIIGDTDAKSPVLGSGITDIFRSVQLENVKTSQCGGDIVVEATVKKKNTTVNS